MISSPPQIQARQILDIVYPIGIIVEFASNVDPNDIMHGQQWELYGQGKTTVCKDSGTFGALGNSVGAETHTLTVKEMPSHRHTVKDGGDNWNSNCGSVSRYDIRGVGGITNNGGYSDTIGNSGMQILGNTGGGQAHNNIQPSIVVLRYRRIG